jgi:PAS domain-containing protein
MPQVPIELILLRQWASYMAMPIWIADSDENLLYYNEPAEILLGRRFDEAGELMLEEVPRYLKLSTEEGAPLALHEFPPAIALRERRPAHRRVRYRGLDRIWRTVEFTAFPVEGQGGHHLGAVAIFWEAQGE